MTAKTNHKILILDGTSGNDTSTKVLKELLYVLEQDGNKDVQIINLRDISINPCSGCFSCWVKTPGVCIYTDQGSEILQTVLNSNTLIFFTPLVFGGFSSELKKITDRFLPMMLPFFAQNNEETHHISRYPNIPRFIGIGITNEPQQESIQCFETLIGRNAINYHATSYSAGTVSSLMPCATLRHQLKKILSQKNALPWKKELIALAPPFTSVPKLPSKTGNALLLMGSPKTTSQSTSAVIGSYLLKKIKEHGLSTSVFHLSKELRHATGESNLCAAIDKADIIIIVSPLHADALSCSTTKALEIISGYKDSLSHRENKRVLAVVNSGFPEKHQSLLALAICRNFTLECGLSWAGGLAMGGGEAFDLCKLPKYFSTLSCASLHHIVRSLNMTATALAQGEPLPQEAIQLIAKTPFPFISFKIWRYFFTKKGTALWGKKAAHHGISSDMMFDKPYKNSDEKKQC